MRACLALAAVCTLAACDGTIDVPAQDPGAPGLPGDPPPVIDDALSKDSSLLAWLSPDSQVQLDPASHRVASVQSAAAVEASLAPPVNGSGPTVLDASAGLPRRFHFDVTATLQMMGGTESLTDELTLAAVVRRSGSASRGRIVMLGAGLSDQEVSVWNIDNGQYSGLRLSDQNDYSSTTNAASQSPFQIVVLSVGQLPASLHLFVDGHYAGAPTLTGAPGSLAYVARDLTLNHPASATEFDLGELLVFRRRLHSAEVDALDLWLGSRWGITPARISGDEGNDPVTFSAVEGILTQHGCTGCHFRGSMTGGGNVLADYDGVHPLVVPGDPDHSRLYLALDRMGAKAEASPLTASEKQAIHDWVLQGAAP
jgi:hypothetical protein